MKVAIDGPAGSGKSTIAKRIASQYGLTYLDTGAMYRACAWLKLKHNMQFDELLALLPSVEFQFYDSGKALKLAYKNNVDDVSEAIRTPEVTALVSDVAANADLRAIMTEKQRAIALQVDVIMDGRDIGTVVLPNAELKFFLTASAEERAKRRTAEWNGKGTQANYDEVLKEIIERDRKDSERTASPLKRSDDATEIDTTCLTIDEVTAIIGDAVKDFRATIGEG
ncbi:MAG: (d)CMP kinase [Deferribacteraceae bacterium]|jgi:cytidylate kinase|nr:(d)CMP kinase [Deferribacteraceae bacterium]